MFLLIETIVGFSVIMLLLSFLVKSLTSVVKNHINYFAGNLKTEVEHFLRETLKESFDKIEDIKKTKAPDVLANVPWRRLGEDYLTLDNMKELLKKITGTDDYENLEARLKRHQSNLKFVFNVRMKNLSLVCGLGLCLFLNINALTIWKTLYTDTQVRAKFTSQKYVAAVLDKSRKIEPATEQATEAEQPAGTTPEEATGAEQPAGTTPEKAKGAEQPAGTTPEKAKGAEQKVGATAKKPEGTEQKAETTTEKTELAKEREAWKKELKNFQTDVNFGIGAVWEKERKDKPINFLFEFLGSLLTGILVSIGAPYWHDILRTLNSMSVSKRKAAQ